jgi:hypothetical protein
MPCSKRRIHFLLQLRQVRSVRHLAVPSVGPTCSCLPSALAADGTTSHRVDHRDYELRDVVGPAAQNHEVDGLVIVIQSSRSQDRSQRRATTSSTGYMTVVTVSRLHSTGHFAAVWQI